MDRARDQLLVDVDHVDALLDRRRQIDRLERGRLAALGGTRRLPWLARRAAGLRHPRLGDRSVRLPGPMAGGAEAGGAYRAGERAQ